jgi:hypothetical protein
LENYLDEVIDNENSDEDAASDDDDEEEEDWHISKNIILCIFHLFEISTQFRWPLGNNI